MRVVKNVKSFIIIGRNFEIIKESTYVTVGTYICIMKIHRYKIHTSGSLYIFSLLFCKIYLQMCVIVMALIISYSSICVVKYRLKTTK